MRKIKFQGKDWLFTGDESGAITTEELFSNFEPSYAHLFPNGEIKRFNRVIGHKSDIEFGEVIDDEKMCMDGLASLLDSPTKFFDMALKERMKE